MGTAAAYLGVHRPPTRAVGRISQQSSFRALRRPVGRAARGPLQVAYVGPPRVDATFPQVGYAISKRCGNAVTRNRLRRRLRAAVTEAAAAQPLPAGCYLIRTRSEATELDVETLAGQVAEALRRASSGTPR